MELARGETDFPPRPYVHPPVPTANAPKLPPAAVSTASAHTRFSDAIFRQPVSPTSHPDEPWCATGTARSHISGDMPRHMPPPIPPPAPGNGSGPGNSGNVGNATNVSGVGAKQTLPEAPPCVGHCPDCDPPKYHRWQSEVRLWLESLPTVATSQLLSKMVTVLPQQAMLDGMVYTEQTGADAETRAIQALMNILDARYGETNSERSWSRLNQFAEFARAPCAHLKD